MPETPTEPQKAFTLESDGSVDLGEHGKTFMESDAGFQFVEEGQNLQDAIKQYDTLLGTQLVATDASRAEKATKIVEDGADLQAELVAKINAAKAACEEKRTPLDKCVAAELAKKAAEALTAAREAATNYLVSEGALYNALGKDDENSDGTGDVINITAPLTAADLEQLDKMRDQYGAEAEDIEESFSVNLVAAMDVLKEQCLFLAFASRFATQKAIARGIPPEQIGQAGALQKVLHPKTLPYDGHIKNASLLVDGPAYSMMNKLVGNPTLKPLYDMTPSDISQLQPMIRLFKTTDTAQDPRTIIAQEIPFDSHTPNDDITTYLKEGGARGVGVGIKGFSFSYRGSNPFAVKKSIEARLEIVANSMEELVRCRKAQVGGQTHYFRYVDLALKTGGSTTDTCNESHSKTNVDFRLRAVVGWAAIPSDIHALNPDVKDALYDSYVTLNLSPTTHEFGITPEGRITFTINYYAYTDETFESKEFSIFNDLNASFRETYRDLQIATAQQLTGQDPSPISCDMVERIRNFYAPQIRQDAAIQTQSLIKSMKKKGKIYYTHFSTAYRTAFIEGDLQNFIKSTALPVVPKLTSRQRGQDYIPFFYIGDLVDVILENIGARLNHIIARVGKIYPEGKRFEGLDAHAATFNQLAKEHRARLMRYQQEFHKLRIVLGSTVMKDIDGNRSNVNIGDIAIPMRFFNDWLAKNLAGRQKSFYPFMPFLNKLLNKLARDFLSNGECFDFSIQQHAKVNQCVVTGYDVESSGMDPLTYAMKQKGKPFLNIDDYTNTTNPKLPLLNVSGIEKQPSTNMSLRDEYNYVIYFMGDMLPGADLVGNKTIDEKRGVFHYSVGRDKGIVKTIDLTRTEMKYLQAVRFEQEGYNGLQQLREVYAAKISCYANVHAYPGTYIYIDPAGWGADDLGDGLNMTQLGLGGYYMIIHSHNSFGPGKADTEIEATWVASKDGARIADPEKKVKVKKCQVSALPAEGTP